MLDAPPHDPYMRPGRRRRRHGQRSLREERTMATLLPFGFFRTPDPFRELRRLQSEMDRVMGTLSAAGELASSGVFPAVNVYAGQDGIAVVAELPGVDKDDLETQAHHDPLPLRAPRRPPSDRREAYHRQE